MAVRQARSERINSKRCDLMTSMLHHLLDRVNRLAAVGLVDEEAGEM